MKKFFCVLFDFHSVFDIACNQVQLSATKHNQEQKSATKCNQVQLIATKCN